MNTLVAIYQSVPPQLWAFLIGTPFIVWFVNVLKKVLGAHYDIVIHALTATTSFLVVAIPTYVLNNPKPFEFLGAYTGVFFLLANLLYAACKALVPFWAAVKKYEDKKAAQHDELIDPTVNSVSSTGSTKHIEVSEYDG